MAFCLMCLQKEAEDRPRKLTCLSATDVPKKSFIIMKSYTCRDYDVGDEVKQFLSKSRVFTYSDDDEADRAMDEVFETDLLKKRQKKTKPIEHNYSKIVYYSDDEADEEVRKIMDESSDSEAEYCDVFGRMRNKKRK